MAEDHLFNDLANVGSIKDIMKNAGYKLHS
mgnify:CR=1 FL=1|jgi:hypothetical protein